MNKLNPLNHPALIALALLGLSVLACGVIGYEVALATMFAGIVLLIWAMLTGKGNVWG